MPTQSNRLVAFPLTQLSIRDFISQAKYFGSFGLIWCLTRLQAVVVVISTNAATIKSVHEISIDALVYSWLHIGKNTVGFLFNAMLNQITYCVWRRPAGQLQVLPPAQTSCIIWVEPSNAPTPKKITTTIQNLKAPARTTQCKIYEFIVRIYMLCSKTKLLVFCCYCCNVRKCRPDKIS